MVHAVRLLVKDRSVDLARGWPVFIGLQQPLATRLLQLAIFHQQLLLLCQVANLIVQVASNESSSTSGHFHEVLGELLVLTS